MKINCNINGSVNKVTRSGKSPLLVIAALAAVSTSALATPSSYQVIDLGAYGNGSTSRAYAVNNNGHVAGVVYIKDANQIERTRAFYYNGTTKVVLNPGTGGNNTAAYGINDSGQLTGYFEEDWGGFIKKRGYRWNAGSGGSVNNIGNFSAAGQFESIGYDINNGGSVAGIASGQSGWSHWHAMRWNFGAQPIDLGCLTGSSADESQARAINSSGVIAGFSEASGTSTMYAATAPANSLVSQGPFPNPLIFEPPLSAYLNDIGDNGSLGGHYQVSAIQYNGMVKINGTWQAVGTLPGGDANDSSYINGINSNNEAVGSSELFNAVNKAILWTPGGGMEDLNTKIPANSGWVLQDAQDISNTGYIVGYGLKNGVLRGFLLRPVTQVSGQIQLQDWLGSNAQVAMFEVRDSVTNQLLETQNVVLGAGGQYSFSTTHTKQIKLTVKTWHWLRAAQTVNATNDVTGVDFSLFNGDIDGDNQVTLIDYDIFSDYYDMTDASPLWFANGPNGFKPVDADLDGDKQVTLLDYDIFSMNFDKVGA